MFGKCLFALTALTASALAQLMIQTPASLIQCQPALLSWSGGTGPYFLAAIPGGQPSAAALKDFGQQSGTSLTWNVDLASGTSITLKITDSTGAINYNQAVTIQAGSSSACLNGGGASASSAVSGASSAAAGSPSTASGAVSSASAAVSSARSSAASAVSSASMMASSAMASAMSSVTRPASTAASGTTTNTATAAAATTSRAAAFPKLTLEAGFLAAVVGAVGVAVF